MFINKISTRLIISCLTLIATTTNSFAQSPAATIEDLSWMTGTWSVDLGPNTLEENWIAADGGSIAAMVRMSGAATTSMFEVIAIEENEGSLILSVQQWDSGFVPRSADAQKMNLVEIGDKQVKFSALTEGSMKTLAYSQPDANTFNIDMETPDGGKFQLSLSPK